MTLVDDILDLEVPAGLCVSLAGDKVAYHTHTKWSNRKDGAHPTSSIWVADVGKPKSARRLTDGTVFHDHAPRWSPNGRYLFFLSNRRTHDSHHSLYYWDINIAENINSVDTRDTLEDVGGFPSDDLYKIILGDVRDYRAARRLPLQVPVTRTCADIVKYDVSPTSDQSVHLAFVDKPRHDDNPIAFSGAPPSETKSKADQSSGQ